MAPGAATLLGDSDGSGCNLVEMRDPRGCNRESGLEVTSGLSPPSHQVISYLLLQLAVGAGTKVVMMEMRRDEMLGSTEGGCAGIPAVSEVDRGKGEAGTRPRGPR